MLSGWKDFDAGDILTANDLQNYVANQTVLHFADASARTTALGTAVETGMISYLDTQGFLEVYNGSSWDAINIGSPLSGGFPLAEGLAPVTTGLSQVASWQQVSQALSPNYIINGAFDIWQRGTSFTSTSLFSADRWRADFSGAPTTWTREQQTFTPGSAPVAGYEGTYFFRSNITTTGSMTFIDHRTRLEDVRILAGQTATFSFFAKADSSRNFEVRIDQYFGSGGSSAVNAIYQVAALTTSWQRFTYTFTMPSISGKTIGTGSYIDIYLRQAGADGSIIDLWGVQLEAGSVATPFRRNANSIQGELAACQRYYQRVFPGNGDRIANGVFVTTTICQFFRPHAPEMRGDPTFAASGTFKIVGASTFTLTGTPTATSLDKSGSTFQATSTVATTAGFAGTLRSDSVSDYVEFSAEL